MTTSSNSKRNPKSKNPDGLSPGSQKKLVFGCLFALEIVGTWSATAACEPPLPMGFMFIV